ncbi:hypothetical protein ABID23_000276 [Bartonella silvatica]|uniref:Uncharacterized protein n=1 Tax=Bartonella silvatica TaxID=357760 RepID=A0ABV2HF86_9HYPH
MKEHLFSSVSYFWQLTPKNRYRFCFYHSLNETPPFTQNKNTIVLQLHAPILKKYLLQNPFHNSTSLKCIKIKPFCTLISLRNKPTPLFYLPACKYCNSLCIETVDKRNFWSLSYYSFVHTSLSLITCKQVILMTYTALK